VLFDPALAVGARFADSLEEAQTIELEWRDEFFGEDGLVPDGYYPDAVGSTSGWLLVVRDQQPSFWRVQNGRVQPTEYGFWVPRTGDAGWDAWVVPLDPSLLSAGETAPLFVAIWGDGGGLTLRILNWDVALGQIEERDVGLSTIADSLFGTGPFSPVRSVSFTAVQSGDSLGFAGGPASLASSVLTMLGENAGFGGQLQVFYLAADAQYFSQLADPLVDEILWASSVPFWGSAGGTIDAPARADGFSPQHLRFVSDFASAWSVLAYQTSPDAAAPWELRAWDATISSNIPAPIGGDGAPAFAMRDRSIRVGRTGTSRIIADIPGARTRETEELGSFWMAGQTVDTSGILRDVYTQIGSGPVAGDDRIVVGIYTRRAR
jgi:hypothetical protein